jgi:hypothetical protein
MISPSIPSCSLYALPRQAVATVNKIYRSADTGTNSARSMCFACFVVEPWVTHIVMQACAWQGLPAPPSDAGLTHIDVLEAAPHDRSPLGLSPTAVSRDDVLRQDIAGVLVSLRRRRHSSRVEFVSRRSDRAICDGRV